MTVVSHPPKLGNTPLVCSQLERMAEIGRRLWQRHDKRGFSLMLAAAELRTRCGCTPARNWLQLLHRVYINAAFATHKRLSDECREILLSRIKRRIENEGTK